jgi:ubiquinone/menaquinone biosynthesis C-methylase UbiE
MKQRIKGGLNLWEERVVGEFFEPPGRILDIGCGAGREAFALHDLGFSVIGVDISEEQLTAARTHAHSTARNIVFKHCSGIALPFEDSSFPFVVAWAQVLGNLSELADMARLLKECSRVLHSGGIISFSGHSHDYISHHHSSCAKGNRFYPWGFEDMAIDL